MFIVDMIGIAAASIAGAMIAIDKRADVFGVLFLAMVTAFGGGILRDMMLGILPRFFTSYSYILCTLISSLLTFCVAYVGHESYRRMRDRLDHIINLFDALAVATYTVTGMDIAIEMQGMANPLLIIFLGITTGIGGGMIRDVLVDQMPFVLRKRIYAVASLFGGLVYYYLLLFGVEKFLSAVIAMVCIYALRILATVFKWNLPRAEV